MKIFAFCLLFTIAILTAGPAFASDTSDAIFLRFLDAREQEEKTESIATEAIDIISRELKQESDNDVMAVENYRLAVLYDSLINDASTWMKNSGPRNDALQKSLELNPDGFDARIFMARRMLLSPANDGGNPEGGKVKMEWLLNEFPNEAPVLLLAGDYYKKLEDMQKAKEYYTKIVSMDPDAYPASKYLMQITAAEAGLSITEMRITGNIKTKAAGLRGTIESFIGRIYSLETADQLNEALYLYPSVDSANISIIDFNDKNIRLEVKLNENNTQVIAVLADAYFYIKPDNTLGFTPAPSLIYVDSNLFGSGLELTGVFSGVYLSAELVVPEHKGLEVDLGFYLDVLAWPGETRFYNNEGLLYNWSMQESASANAAFFIRKELPIGLTLKTKHNIKYCAYSSDETNFTAQDSSFTYTGNLSAEFTTQPLIDTSAFSFPEGIKVFLEPSIIYRFNYSDWGPEDALFTHNEVPAYKGKYLISYGSELTKLMNFALQLSYLHGINLYTLNEWVVGQTNPLDPFPRLSGYFQNEFRTANSALLNLDYIFRFPGNRVGLMVKHDVFYHGESSTWYQGTSTGIAVKLGDQFELAAQGAIGWNSRHQSQPAWTAGLTFQYLNVK